MIGCALQQCRITSHQLQAECIGRLTGHVRRKTTQGQTNVESFSGLFSAFTSRPKSYDSGGCVGVDIRPHPTANIASQITKFVPRTTLTGFCCSIRIRSDQGCGGILPEGPLGSLLPPTTCDIVRMVVIRSWALSSCSSSSFDSRV